MDSSFSKNTGLVVFVLLGLGLVLGGSWFFLSGIQGSAVGDSRVDSVSLRHDVEFPDDVNYRFYDWADHKDFERAYFGDYSVIIDDISKTDSYCKADYTVKDGGGVVASGSYTNRMDQSNVKPDWSFDGFRVSGYNVPMKVDRPSGEFSFVPDSVESCTDSGFGTTAPSLSYEVPVDWDEIEFNSSVDRGNDILRVNIDYRNNWKPLVLDSRVQVNGSEFNDSQSKTFDVGLGTSSVSYVFYGVPDYADVSVDASGSVLFDTGSYTMTNVEVTEKWEQIKSRKSIDYNCDEVDTEPCADDEWSGRGERLEEKQSILNVPASKVKEISLSDFSFSKFSSGVVEKPVDDGDSTDSPEDDGSDNQSSDDGSSGNVSDGSGDESSDSGNSTDDDTGFFRDLFIQLEIWFYDLIEF